MVVVSGIAVTIFFGGWLLPFGIDPPDWVDQFVVCGENRCSSSASSSMPATLPPSGTTRLMSFGSKSCSRSRPHPGDQAAIIGPHDPVRRQRRHDRGDPLPRARLGGRRLPDVRRTLRGLEPRGPGRRGSCDDSVCPRKRPPSTRGSRPPAGATTGRGHGPRRSASVLAVRGGLSGGPSTSSPADTPRPASRPANGVHGSSSQPQPCIFCGYCEVACRSTRSRWTTTTRCRTTRGRT